MRKCPSCPHFSGRPLDCPRFGRDARCAAPDNRRSLFNPARWLFGAKPLCRLLDQGPVGNTARTLRVMIAGTNLL